MIRIGEGGNMKQEIIHPIEKMNLKSAVRTAECIFSRCRDPEVRNAAEKALQSLQDLQKMVIQKERS